MAVNLIDLLKGEFAGALVTRLAAASGQTSETTHKVIEALVPAVVGALASKTSTPAGAAEMIRTLQRTGLDGTRFTSAALIFEGSGGVRALVTMGGPLVSAIFGERTNAVNNWLASHAGIGTRSSLSLLTLLVPLVGNFVSKHAARNGRFDALALASLLTGQSGHLRAAAPPGLAMALGPEDFGRPAIVVEPSGATTGGVGGTKCHWCWRFLRWRSLGWASAR